MNDEVIQKTRDYINKFVPFKNVVVSSEMRKVARDHDIPYELCIRIQDLSLRDYDEALSLYPELKEYPQEYVQELIDIIKINQM